MERSVDPYFILGIEREASQEEIKRAYRNLVRAFHPDRNRENPEAEQRFREVQQAYELIGKEDKRRQYDAIHRSPFSSYGTAGAPSSFSSLFKKPPAPGQRGRPAVRGRDVEVEVNVAFDDALRGTTAEVQVEIEGVCPDCDGDRNYRELCRQCGGSGLESGEDHLATKICPRCHGSGQVSCLRCDGVGRVKETRRHKVKIPAGVDEGTRIRIAGKGAPGASGGAPGDLYVTTRIEPSTLFERRGGDLILEVPVTYPEAVLGAQVVLPTPDGPISLKIPPNSLHGRLLRVRGRGAPKIGEGERGDLFARIAITLPEEPSDDERDLLETLMDVSTESPRAHFFASLAESTDESPDVSAADVDADGADS